jgi:hypothetical protein
MLRRAICALGVALAGVVAAQEPEAPPAGPALAAALRQAEQSGALERLLVPRWFEDEAGGVVRARGERLEGGGLRLSVEFLPVAAMREERTRLSCDLGPDGAVRALESESVRGAQRTLTRGEVVDGKLHLRAEPGGEASTCEWGPEVLPLPLLAFALPALCDQGLPARLGLRVFHGFARAPEERRATLTWEARDGTWHVQVSPLSEGQPGCRFVLDAQGAPRELVLSGMRLTPIDAAEGQRRVGPQGR